MKSVLPSDLESKRIKIAKAHNRLVCVLLGLLFVGLLLIAVFLPHGPTHKPSSMALVVAFLAVGLLEAYGLYRIIQHEMSFAANWATCVRFVTSGCTSRVHPQPEGYKCKRLLQQLHRTRGVLQ